MNYSGRNVVVTGADGFIGSHVAEALVNAGANVTALALYSGMDSHGWLDSLSSEMRKAMRLVRGDVRDPGFVMRLLQGQDICMHLAALIAIPFSYHAPQSYVDVNVTGTLNVLEAARTHGLFRVVHTSTSEVYGTAKITPMDETHPLQGQSPYSASKIGADMMVEAFARSFDLPAVILRPFNTFGPRQSERALIASVIRQALDPACEVIRVGDLAPKRDFTYVADTADAFLAVGLEDGLEYGLPYNGGTGRAVSIGETVEAVLTACSTRKPILQEAERLRPSKSEVQTLMAENSRLRKATGWQPRVSLEDGIARTIEWWREGITSGRVRPGAEYIR